MALDATVVSTTIGTTTSMTGGTSTTVTSLLAVPVLDLAECTGVVPYPVDEDLRDLASALEGMCAAANVLADAVSRSPSFDLGWNRHPEIHAATVGLVEAGDRLEAAIVDIRSASPSAPGSIREFLDEMEWTLSGSELELKYLPGLLDTHSGQAVEEYWHLGHVGLPTFLDRKIAQFDAMLDESPTLEGWMNPCFGVTVGFNGSAAGWIVNTPTFELWIEGTANPDGVTVGSRALQIERRNYWWHVSTTLQLTEGVNEVPVAVTCNGDEALAVTVPITYMPGAEVRLADAVSATSESITLDWLRWDESGEFPGPTDDDPGITETLPVSEDLVVWLRYTDHPDYDYAWLVERIEAGEPTDDYQWAPDYPYNVTISNGVVVQLELVQLG